MVGPRSVLFTSSENGGRDEVRAELGEFYGRGQARGAEDERTRVRVIRDGMTVSDEFHRMPRQPPASVDQVWTELLES